LYNESICSYEPKRHLRDSMALPIRTSVGGLSIETYVQTWLWSLVASSVLNFVMQSFKVNYFTVNLVSSCILCLDFGHLDKQQCQFILSGQVTARILHYSTVVNSNPKPKDVGAWSTLYITYRVWTLNSLEGPWCSRRNHRTIDHDRETSQHDQTAFLPPPMICAALTYRYASSRPHLSTISTQHHDHISSRLRQHLHLRRNE
jgi:hypothetical protein